LQISYCLLLPQVPVFNGGPRVAVTSQRSFEKNSSTSDRRLSRDEPLVSDTVSSQRSKENICEGVRPNISTSSLGSSRARSATNTPSKPLPGKEGAKNAFVTPIRPAAQKSRCFGGDPLPNPAVLAARRSLDINSDGSPKISLRAVGDLAEQVQSLKKERSSLEAQKLELETNFQQIQSQLDAVLLFQEVCCNSCHVSTHSSYLNFNDQDESIPAETQQEILEERNRLREKVGHLEAALAAMTERESLKVHSFDRPKWETDPLSAFLLLFEAEFLLYYQKATASQQAICPTQKKTGKTSSPSTSVCSQFSADGDLQTQLDAAKEEVRHNSQNKHCPKYRFWFKFKFCRFCPDFIPQGAGQNLR
jgi:hypothetical protein